MRMCMCVRMCVSTCVCVCSSVRVRVRLLKLREARGLQRGISDLRLDKITELELSLASESRRVSAKGYNHDGPIVSTLWSNRPKLGIIGEKYVLSPVCNSDDRYWCLRKKPRAAGSDAVSLVGLGVSNFYFGVDSLSDEMKLAEVGIVASIAYRGKELLLPCWAAGYWDLQEVCQIIQLFWMR